MRPPYQTGLLSALAGFLTAMILAWLSLFLEIIPIYLESWTPVVLLSLLIGVLVGLFVWLRAHIAALSDRVIGLSYELEKLKKKQ